MEVEAVTNKIVIIIRIYNGFVVLDDESGYLDLPCVLAVENEGEFIQSVYDKYKIIITYGKDLFEYENNLWRLCSVDNDFSSMPGMKCMHFEDINQRSFKNNYKIKLNEYMTSLNNKEKVKLVFALKDNKIAHISEIDSSERGLDCNCICPNCKGELQAKIGYGKKAPHFAHNGSECDLDIAGQTALHILAKEILEAKKEIVLPAYKINIKEEDLELATKGYHQFEIEKVEKELLFFNERRIKFKNIYLEKRVDSIIPDIIIEINGKQLIVEIAVTHFVDEEKAKEIEKMNISAIEIDLSHLKNEELQRENIEDIIINMTTNKKWIYNIYSSKAHEKLWKRNEKIIDEIHKERIKLEIARKAAEKQKEELEKKEFDEKQKSKLAVESALNVKNYAKEIEKRRNDNEAAKYIKDLNFYQKGNAEIPFFVDLPIMGEIVFDCDRRIWQSAIFYKFFYCRKKLEQGYNEICFAKIWSWLTKRQKIFRISWELNKCKEFQANGRYYSNCLAYLALKQYLLCLGFIGFISCGDDVRYREEYEIAPRVIIPPNNENAKKLVTLISENNKPTPIIDDIIRKETFNKRNNSYCYKREDMELNSVERDQADIDECRKTRKYIEAKQKIEYLEGKKQAQIKFDSYSGEILTDFYNRRWLYCDKCMQLKREDEMANYQGGKGVCWECFKK